MTGAANRTELAVVGAGAAGLFTALTAARAGARVTLVSATPLAESASFWAQGGLAAALAAEDHPDRHLADTLAAGRGAVRRSAAATLCDEAPARVAELQRLGVRFDADRHGRLALGLEGGHSTRRVVHAGGSATGRRVTRQLSALVASEPRIDVLEHRRAVDLWVAHGRCVGVACDDGRVLGARAVVLATGGAAALWERSTNPAGAVGAGLLLAHSAGAALADLELVQFHPTALMTENGANGFLVTEAVRGEGARLLDADGERFVDELAPRDEVALAIQHRLRATGARSVGLDLRSVDPALFPNVFGALRRAGLDPARAPVPVAPAAHYMMGGIATDLLGRSRLPGLYAVGECACTGLHGANRLASNSLSECFVFGRRAALSALDEPALAEDSAPAPPPPDPPVAPAPSAQSRAALWRDAGLERSAAGLLELTGDSHPLVRMIASSGLLRDESRGAHHRSDALRTNPALDARHVVIGADGIGRLEHWA